MVNSLLQQQPYLSGPRGKELDCISSRGQRVATGSFRLRAREQDDSLALCPLGDGFFSIVHVRGGVNLARKGREFCRLENLQGISLPTCLPNSWGIPGAWTCVFVA